MNLSTWAGSGSKATCFSSPVIATPVAGIPQNPCAGTRSQPWSGLQRNVKPATDSQNNQHLCFEEPPSSSTILFQEQLVYGACKWVEICLLEGRQGYGARTKEKLRNWRGAAPANLIPWQPKCQAKCIRGYSLCPSKDGGYQNHQWVKPKIESKC